MTRRTLKIAALSTHALLVLLLLTAGTARAQSGRTFYIDYNTGSDTNLGTQASPWKSHPDMHCSTHPGSGSGSYAHLAGDHFIFKGGVTWPAPCLPLIISAGGTSASTVSAAGAAPTINGADYYGVDVTWFSGGSFAKPVFDAQGTTPTGLFGAIVEVTANYVTLDDIEMKNALQAAVGFARCTRGTIDLETSTGVVMDRLYLHDWSIGSLANQEGGWHAQASICGNIDTGSYADAVYNTEMSDAAQPAGSQFGTCFIGLGEIAYSNCHNVGEFLLYDYGPIHDNLLHDADGNTALNIPTGGPSGAHANGIEFQNVAQPSAYYNNYEYNADVGFNVLCPGTAIYNNIFSKLYNSGAPGGLYEVAIDENCFGVLSTTQTPIYNNTIDPSGPGGGGGLRIYPRSGGVSGVVTFKNNIYINTANDLSAATQPPVQSNNLPMRSSEALTYGFTATNKYKPSSSDPNVSKQGANLTSLCSGSLIALCQDTSGAPWFGGSYITRPTGSCSVLGQPGCWDLGAFQGQGGTTGPPTLSINTPASGTVSGSQNLTATCTPQGTATCTSVQYAIDGFSFGAAQTSSPYTLAWNTATAANANHVISATATDSNGQTGTASTVTVTVSNSMPGCFVSTDNDSGALSWTANQAFTAQSANFTATVVLTPNSSGTNQDGVTALSQSPISAYSQGAALIRFNGSTGNIDVYKGSISNYTSDNAAPFTSGTAYTFSITVNFTGPNAGTYSVAETSPSNIAIATNYAFRSTASTASLGYINAISDNTTPDTEKVCSFQVGSAASLTFSPANLNFGNITVGANATQTITATTSGGSVNFSSVSISGNPDFTILTGGTCTGSVPSSCATQIKFAPTSAALETATLTFTDDATGSPQTVAVSGTGVPATPTLSVNPASVNFGSVHVHTTSSSGPIVLTISSGPVTFTGTPSLGGANAADFALASNTCTGTASASSCQTVLSFTPSLVAAESATLTYTDNATASPQTVALTGSGYLAPHPPTAVHATVN